MRRLSLMPLLLACVSFLFGGCATFRKSSTPPELARLGFKASAGDFRVFHHTGKGVLKLFPEKRFCYINGMQFYLPHAVTVDDDGRCRVSDLSIEKVIKPLFAGVPRKTLIRTVLLDPGHGEHNFGAVGKKYKEKDLNLSLAKAISAALKKRGIQVRMTRMNDKFLTLDQRGKLARKKNGDLFLSIHHNASPNRDACGVETYIVTPGGAASSNDAENQIHRFKVQGNSCDAENIRLAALMQKNMVKYSGRVDRGVRFARFRVLTLSTLPGALIEAGFVSNEKEESSCGKAGEQRKIAEAIADAIVSYNSK